MWTQLMMQWSNLTKCGLFFNIVSPVVHTLFPLVLQRLESCCIGGLILILEKSPQHTADMISSSVQNCFPAKCFFILGNRKYSDGAKSWEYGTWSTSSKPQSCTAAIAATDLCAGALSWWNRTPFISFPGRSWNVCITTFQSPEILIECGFIWKETM